MATQPFLKMHGLGNDFVMMGTRAALSVLSRLKGKIPTEEGKKPTANEIQALSHRNFGLGCDQLIWLAEPKDSTAQIRMEIYNRDGSQAEACGNATRCVAWLLGQEKVVIETPTSLLSCHVISQDEVAVAMGPVLPQDLEGSLSLTLSMNAAPVFVTVGNPHLVLFVEEMSRDKKEVLGQELSQHPAFPEGVNVGFVSQIQGNEFTLHVYERGTGLTYACGSGACAAARAVWFRGLAQGILTVHLPGGDLQLEKLGEKVNMTGPVSLVALGQVEIPEISTSGLQLAV